jgi:hypothetical protein
MTIMHGICRTNFLKLLLLLSCLLLIGVYRSPDKLNDTRGAQRTGGESLQSHSQSPQARRPRTQKTDGFPVKVPVIDFTFYWVAARHFWLDLNPYAPVTPGDPVMFAPPWIIPVIAWLGPFRLHTATFLWLVVSAIAFGIAAIWLWQIYGEGQNPGWAVVLTASFTPVAFMFVAGQIDALPLLGIAGFLRYEAKRPYLAGAFLFLAALKPQIVFLIWLALVVLALAVRKWKPLAGFFPVFLLANLVTFLLRPSVFAEWRQVLRQDQVFFFDTATIGYVLRHFTGLRFAQYVPALAAFTWFGLNAATRVAWDWKKMMPALLLVSLVAAPYAWYQDHVMLLPALFVAVVKLLHRPTHIPVIVAAYLGLNAVGLSYLMIKCILGYAWIPLCWLILYRVILGSHRRSTPVSLPFPPAFPDSPL